MVLTRERTIQVENTALRLLIEKNETSLPVDPKRLAESDGFAVAFRDFSGDESSHTGKLIPDERIILVDINLNEQRTRFVVAHELGHVRLGHSGDKDRDTSQIDVMQELEAELFARALLMPKPYLLRAVSIYQAKDRDYTAFTSLKEYISYVFNVTQEKARIRLEECGFARVD